MVNNDNMIKDNTSHAKKLMESSEWQQDTWDISANALEILPSQSTLQLHQLVFDRLKLQQTSFKFYTVIAYSSIQIASPCHLRTLLPFFPDWLEFDSFTKNAPCRTMINLAIQEASRTLNTYIHLIPFADKLFILVHVDSELEAAGLRFCWRRLRLGSDELLDIERTLEPGVTANGTCCRNKERNEIKKTKYQAEHDLQADVSSW